MKGKLLCLVAILCAALGLAAFALLRNAGYEPHVYSVTELAVLREAENADFEDWKNWKYIENGGITGGPGALAVVSDTPLLPDSPETFVSTFAVIGTGRYLGAGSVVGMGNGVVKLPGAAVFDDTAYYLETYYMLDRVLQGEEYLAPRDTLPDDIAALADGGAGVVMAYEYMGYGKYATEKALSTKEDCEYLLAFKLGADGESVYFKHLYTLNPVDASGRITWRSEAMNAAAGFSGVTTVRKLAKCVAACG